MANKCLVVNYGEIMLYPDIGDITSNRYINIPQPPRVNDYTLEEYLEWIYALARAFGVEYVVDGWDSNGKAIFKPTPQATTNEPARIFPVATNPKVTITF